MQAEKLGLPEGANLQETVYNVEGYTYRVDLHELPSGIFGILHMPAVQSVQIHDWEVKSEPGGSAYVSHNIYITVPLTPSFLRLKSTCPGTPVKKGRFQTRRQLENFITGTAYTKLCDLSSFHLQCVQQISKLNKTLSPDKVKTSCYIKVKSK
jgi:hypothetical protein